MTIRDDFTWLPDLACSRLGGQVLAANDEFFAPKERLVADEVPVWDADRYTDHGKWMDGWETRRRREPGHDWCLIRLGVPGIVHGVVVDTAHFTGNFPEACSLEGCEAPADATPDQLVSSTTDWTELLPRSPLSGDSENRFSVTAPYRFTHLRLHIYPDGGVARLRVHGQVVPRTSDLGSGAPADLGSVALGGRVVAASDRFYSSPGNLLLPDAPRGMHDGWETRRRRGPGNDWVVIALAAAGRPERVEIDTAHFKGNAPGAFSLEGSDSTAAVDPSAATDESLWRPLVERTEVRPHELHEISLDDAGDPVRAVRLQIYPDGGVARLRVIGRVDADEARRLALTELNVLPPASAERKLLDCCGSRRWIERMAARRPFADPEALFAAAEEVADELERDDWLEAFAAHPPIGGGRDGSEGAERPRGETSDAWSRGEQAGASDATEDLRERLAAGNQAYRRRFGFLYIVCASGKSGEEMLDLLQRRLTNDPERELSVAATEERKIIRIRLDKLLGEPR